MRAFVNRPQQAQGGVFGLLSAVQHVLLRDSSVSPSKSGRLSAALLILRKKGGIRRDQFHKKERYLHFERIKKKMRFTPSP